MNTKKQKQPRLQLNIRLTPEQNEYINKRIQQTQKQNTIRPGLHKRKPRLHTAPHGTDHIPNKIPRQQNKRIIAKIRPVKHSDRKTPKRTARRL